jgi:hypothetical protein
VKNSRPATEVGAAHDSFSMPRKSIGRTLIESHKGDKRYVRRNESKQFKTEVNVGRSLTAAKRSKAKSKAPKVSRDRSD